MKSILFIALIFLALLVNIAYSDSNSTTADLFGLKMEVIAPFPDQINDGVDMDTVRFGFNVSVIITYKNLTGMTQRNFEISAFFPNRFESYTKLIMWNQRPDYVDPDSSVQASWYFPKLNPSDSGKIEFTLVVNRAPKDTIYLSYETIARAISTPVSQISHTNIYVPSGPGIRPYPNLTISKADSATEVYPGDIINYKIEYNNIGDIGGIPAEKVVILDTLPANFTFLDAQSIPEIDTLPDGRILLIWYIQHIVPYSYSGTLDFRVRVDLIADRDSLVYNKCRITSAVYEIDLTNNADKEPILVKPKINLAIYQIGPDEYSLARDESQDFRLRCKNLSSLNLNNIKVAVKIDDMITGSNIYMTQNIDAGGIPINDSLIQWTIPELPAQDSTDLTFGTLINHIEKTQNYTIYFKAAIDSQVQLADKIHADVDSSNNQTEWIVHIDGTPDLSIKIEPDKVSAMANEIRSFKLTCSNLSIATLDSVRIRAYIADDENGFNYYTLTSNLSEQHGKANADTTRIEWLIPPLNKDETKELNFNLSFDKLKKPYRDYPNFTIKATIDTVETDPIELQNNVSSCNLYIDGTPNLAIQIKETSNRTIVNPNSTANFKLTCQNLSSPTFEIVKLHVKIEGENIFTITPENGALLSNNLIEWKIPSLAFEQSIEEYFNIAFDKIPGYGSYKNTLFASVDTVEVNPQEFIDNIAKWEISINAMPQVILGPISIEPSNPILKSTVEYGIPYSSRGNFTARDALMTIEVPDFTFALYYIQNGIMHQMTDTMLTEFQIPLGDLDPGYEGNVLMGIRIYAYKQLPGSAPRPLVMNFKSSITFDGGIVNASRSDRVLYDPAIADLILDKNIVAPDKLPLEITFKSSDFGEVEIKIYNLAGEFIKIIYKGPVDRGDTYTYDWNGLNETGSPVSSGVYFVYAVSKFYNGYKKVIIVK